MKVYMNEKSTGRGTGRSEEGVSGSGELKAHLPWSSPLGGAPRGTEASETIDR